MRDHILLGYDLRDRYISIRGQPHSSGKMYYQASKDTEIWPRIIGAPKVENEFGLLCYETAIASSRERVLIMAKAKRCDVSFLSDSEARVYGPKNSMNNPTWDFIGYDVVDKCYYYSALFNFGLDGNAVETKAIKDVNKYGLIDSYDSADEFARYFSSNRNAINHTPFCPIALFVEGDA